MDMGNSHGKMGSPTRDSTNKMKRKAREGSTTEMALIMKATGSKAGNMAGESSKQKQGKYTKAGTNMENLSFDLPVNFYLTVYFYLLFTETSFT